MMARRRKPERGRRPPRKRPGGDGGKHPGPGGGGDHGGNGGGNGGGGGGGQEGGPGDVPDADDPRSHKGTGPSESAVVAGPGSSGVAFETGYGTLFGQGQATGYANPSVYSSDPGDPVRHYHQQPVYIHEVAATTTPATTDTGATANTNATPSQGSAP